MVAQLKYPKFILLIITVIFAYTLFEGRDLFFIHNIIAKTNYFGAFAAGLLFVYGFTAAPATTLLLITAKNQNLIITGLTAGFGALLGDLLIFNFIRHSFSDEIEKLTKEKILIWLHLKTPNVIKKYFLPIFAGILIASPLPDEIGVSIIASSFNISLRVFSIIAFLLNTLGIFIILLIGRYLV